MLFYLLSMVYLHAMLAYSYAVLRFEVSTVISTRGGRRPEKRSYQASPDGFISPTGSPGLSGPSFGSLISSLYRSIPLAVMSNTLPYSSCALRRQVPLRDTVVETSCRLTKDGGWVYNFSYAARIWSSIRLLKMLCRTIWKLWIIISDDQTHKLTEHLGHGLTLQQGFPVPPNPTLRGQWKGKMSLQAFIIIPLNFKKSNQKK